MLESRFCGLPFSRVQYEYRVFTNGLPRIISMGQNPYDGSIAHFPDHGGSVGCSRSKHSLAAWVTIQAAEVIPCLICWFGLKHSTTDSVRHDIQFLEMIYD